jgi:hypothetical protein
MEPVTTITTAWTLAKTAGEVGKKLFELTKDVKDRDLKQRIDEVLDTIRVLKQSAAELEDENRELREKLRFKSDAYELRLPFWYEKTKPQLPLCPKCFAKGVAAPMAERSHPQEKYRRCLVCNNVVVDKPDNRSFDQGGSVFPEGFFD